MNIKFHSTVLFTKDFDKMKLFYTEVLGQDIKADFDNCILFGNGLSLWEIKENYPIAKMLGRVFSESGNKNLEICFETESFDDVLEKLDSIVLEYIHKEQIEVWGQRTIRFYDPERNIIEIGESIPCLIRRFAASGFSSMEIAQKTSVSIDYINSILKN